ARVVDVAPAPAGIARAEARDRLRVEDHESIGIGPAVVARLAHEVLADRIGALAAAVEGDVHRAALAFARRGNIRVAGIGQADRVGVAAGERLLVKGKQAPALLERWRLES